MQVRIGPNRVGPLGLLQPIADGVKLMFKEIIVPTGADKVLFLLGAGDGHRAGAGRLGGGAVRPDRLVLANVNAGPALPAGDHLDGRLRRHHRRLGVELEVRLPRRACARRRRWSSYEIAMGFALVVRADGVAAA